MIFLLELLVFLCTIFCVFNVITKSKNFCVIIPVFYIYNFVMMFPIILEMFLGIPYRGYYGLKLALNDEVTTFIFCCFALIIEIILYREVLRQVKEVRRYSLRDEYKKFSQNVTEFFEINTSLRFFLKVLAIIGLLLFVVGILCAPNPAIYFKKLAAFTMFSSERTPNEIEYNNLIMSKLGYVCAISIILIKLVERDNIAYKFLRYVMLGLLVFINGKRSLVMIIVGVWLLVDFIRKPDRKSTKIKFVLGGVLLACFFFIYAYATGKYYYNTDWYATINEYLFRAETVRASIFSINHPDKLKILEYPGQSVLYNLFYFVPRSIWGNKPYPYSVYYFSAINGFDSLHIADWRFQTSLWAEFISNFGYLGMFLSVIFIIKLSRFFNKRKVTTKLLGTGLLCILQLFEYSDLLKVVVIVIILLTILEKVYMKKGKIIIKTGN